MRRRLSAAAAVTLVLAVGQAAQAASFNPDPIFPVGSISGTASHQIVKLDHVASALAGRHATVNCWSQSDWTRLQAWRGVHHYLIDVDGITFPKTDRIQLSPLICQILQQVLARSARQPLYTADAVTVLAHESAHASGIKAENLAECHAIKTEPRAAQLLGLSKALGMRLQHVYRGTIYPYELPRYRTPPCTAGLPGVVVPDTLGTTASLRPLKHMATAVARALAGWRVAGGSVGPLSPCAPITSRTFEDARFADAVLGPQRESLDFAVASLHTRKEFETVLGRFQEQPRCDLADLRRQIRESHWSATVSPGRIPASITRLSHDVRAYRDIWTFQGKSWNRDSIFILNRVKRTMATLFFRAPVGKLAVSLELRATEAGLHALRQFH